MRHLVQIVLLLGLVLQVSGPLASSASGEEKPYGLQTRVPWTTSRVVGTPDPPPPYTVKRAFPKLKFKNPLYIIQEPGTDRFLVGELSGKIYAFTKDTPDSESRELFLDTGRQLYSLSFHPDYETNGQVFVFSPKELEGDAEKQLSRVSRFQTTREHPRRASPESEQIIVQWQAGGHNGGEAIIGPDGYLYISTGDSSSGSDPKATGQGVGDLLSVIMRIDVDNPEPDRAYSIPKDNPFVNYPGSRPEIWAFGFRNPWRMSFDAKTGRLWVGDVGQDLWEMIWLVERGGNYGWSVYEGTHPFHPNKEMGPGPILPPVVERHHTECRSITGGYVYYGDKFPELNGVYFYGDYEYGQIWGVRHDNEKVTWHKELANTALRIPTFGVSRDGDIYLMDHVTGELYELERSPESSANSRFPRRLSETGIFASVADHQVARGVIPYSVNTPQWLDNATKERFVALPDESTVKFAEKSANASTWSFDDSSVCVETISLETETGKPQSNRRIETRILVKQENHWLGYSYLWNDEQTDATLVEAQGRDITLMIKEAPSVGGTRQQTWHVPSRNECMVCHSRAAGFVLGLRTLQMNRDHDYGDVVDNQLRALNHIGVFTKPLSKAPVEYEALPDAYDANADLNSRARAYLYVNCSVCHVSDGGGNARFKVSYDLAPEAMDLIDERPMHGDFGLLDARLVAPGDPYASVLFYRLSKLGRGRMPHVGTRLTDERGLDLIHDWIVELSPNKNDAKNHEYEAIVQKLTDLNGSGSSQQEAIDQILTSTRTALVLARSAVKEPSLESVHKQIIASAVGHPNVNVRDLFERFVPEDQRIRRLGETIDPQSILALEGSAERGRELFFAATASQCKNCHRINDVGGTLGPDLSDIGKRYKRHEILESLIAPSKKIDPKYATMLMATTDGKVMTGILVEKTDSEVALNVLKDGEGKLVRTAAEDVEELLPQQKSLMPDLMLRDFTAQQAADLLEYLFLLKGPG